MTNSPIEKELQELRDSYLAALPEKLKEIQQLYQHAQRQPAKREFIENLRLLAHRLRGTSATYGFLHVSDCAAKLENGFENALSGQNISVESVTEQLNTLLPIA